MEATQMVVDKLSTIHLNVEMTVAEANEAIEKCDMNKMVDLSCKVLVQWEKTRGLVELYQNLSIDYILEIVGNWVMNKYIR
jgi:hypothetical protein